MSTDPSTINEHEIFQPWRWNGRDIAANFRHFRGTNTIPWKFNNPQQLAKLNRFRCARKRQFRRMRLILTTCIHQYEPVSAPAVTDGLTFARLMCTDFRFPSVVTYIPRITSNEQIMPRTINPGRVEIVSTKYPQLPASISPRRSTEHGPKPCAEDNSMKYKRCCSYRAI